ncbi:MAG: hypothetical protein ACOC8E_07930 [Planctomycetota bacterium]
MRRLLRALGGVFLWTSVLVVSGCGGATEDAETRERIISTIERSGEVTEFKFVPSGESGVIAFEETVEGHGKFGGTYDGEWVWHYSVED